MTLSRAEDRLQDSMKRLVKDRRHRLAVYIERMKGLSPLEKLNSGYSFVTDDEGRNIRSVNQVKTGQNITVTVSDGSFTAEVKQCPD